MKKKYTIKKLVWEKDEKDSFVSQYFCESDTFDHFTVEKMNGLWHCWYYTENIGRDFNTKKEAVQRCKDFMLATVERFCDEDKGEEK